MKSTYKNSEMVLMLQSLEPILTQRNKIGYIAARNYRLISEALTEYNSFKSELIGKYGEPETNNGVETGVVSLKFDSPNFKQFSDELAPINEIRQEVDILTAKYEDTIGLLSGAEIIAIDWMLED